MVNLNIFVAFTSGLVSFFAPCVVPLLPTYVAYIFGVSLKDRKKVVEESVFYLLGFSLIFVVLGAFAGTIGVFLRSLDFWLLRIGGVVLIAFGLETLGVFHFAFPTIGRLPSVPASMQQITSLRSFFLGMVFSLAWTPCVGAILGSILLLASSTKDPLNGALLLFVYSLGISLPFLIISFTIAKSRSALLPVERIMPVILKVSGLVLIAIGLLLLTDTFKYLNTWIFEMAFRLGYQVR